MTNSKRKLPDNEIAVYQTADGSINIEVLYANENIWLPQKRIAELFDVDRSVVTKHLKNIFSDSELQEDSVCAKFAHTAEDFSVVQTGENSMTRPTKSAIEAPALYLLGRQGWRATCWRHHK